MQRAVLLQWHLLLRLVIILSSFLVIINDACKLRGPDAQILIQNQKNQKTEGNYWETHSFDLKTSIPTTPSTEKRKEDRQGSKKATSPPPLQPQTRRNAKAETSAKRLQEAHDVAKRLNDYRNSDEARKAAYVAEMPANAEKDFPPPETSIAADAIKSLGKEFAEQAQNGNSIEKFESDVQEWNDAQNTKDT